MKITVTFILMFLLSVSTVDADYQIDWHTIDGGGGQSGSGQYTVTGTIGQPDAAYSAGGQYELLGGFWPTGPICIVEFEDFARMADYWQRIDCNEMNGWCNGADLNEDSNVDEYDLAEFVDYWLYCCPYNWPLE